MSFPLLLYVLRGEQNREGYGNQSGQYQHNLGGDYKWYQSHALVGSVNPTCVPVTGVDCRNPKGGPTIHEIPHRLKKHMGMCL